MAAWWQSVSWLCYGLQHSAVVVLFTAGAAELCLVLRAQTGSRSPCWCRLKPPSSRKNLPELETYPTTPSLPEVKNDVIYASLMNVTSRSIHALFHPCTSRHTVSTCSGIGAEQMEPAPLIPVCLFTTLTSTSLLTYTQYCQYIYCKLALVTIPMYSILTER
jgi:hypothetical protein